MTVCLFDIDGTLIASGGCGGRAMIAAVAEEFDVPPPELDIPFAGRSDRSIVPDIFAAAGVEFRVEDWGRFKSRYLTKLAAELAESQGRVLNGVVDVLERLESADGVELGLLTGNLQDGAQAKLSHFGIADYFSFGGFGDEHPHRDDIAREAAAIVRTRWESEREMIVIGDTPADIQCGRAIEATTVAVATGSYSMDLLTECNPDHAFESLVEAEAFFESVIAAA